MIVIRYLQLEHRCHCLPQFNQADILFLKRELETFKVVVYVNEDFRLNSSMFSKLGPLSIMKVPHYPRCYVLEQENTKHMTIGIIRSSLDQLSLNMDILE